MMSGVPTSCEPPYTRIGCGVLLVSLALAYFVVGAILMFLLGLLS